MTEMSISEPIPYFKLAHSKGLTLPLRAILNSANAQQRGATKGASRH